MRQTRCWPGYRRENRLTGGASRSKRAAGRDHLPWWRAILLQSLFALEVPGALSDSSTYKLTIWADRVHCAPIPVNRQSAHQLPNALGCDGKQFSDAPVATLDSLAPPPSHRNFALPEATVCEASRPPKGGARWEREYEKARRQPAAGSNSADS